MSYFLRFSAFLYALDIIGKGQYNLALHFGGGLAQLGERNNGIVEVMGSSPISSTIKKRSFQKAPFLN